MAQGHPQPQGGQAFRAVFQVSDFRQRGRGGASVIGAIERGDERGGGVRAGIVIHLPKFIKEGQMIAEIAAVPVCYVI